MAETKPDYEIDSLAKVLMSVDGQLMEFSTEESKELLMEKLETARANNTMFEFTTIVTEFVFGGKINTCREVISLDLNEVKVPGIKEYKDITPKKSEGEKLEDTESE